MSAVKLREGTVVVLEGLDRSGKSTQIARLRALQWETAPIFAHMPSGVTELTAGLYRLLEDSPPRSPLAQQLLHLACHAENLPVLRKDGSEGLVLDRWWWSTLAYGWHGANLAAAGVDLSALRSIIDTIWQPIRADLILLFLHTFAADSKNREAVRSGYVALAEAEPDTVVQVPRGAPDDVATYVLSELKMRGLLMHGTTRPRRT